MPPHSTFVLGPRFNECVSLETPPPSPSSSSQHRCGSCLSSVSERVTKPRRQARFCPFVAAKMIDSRDDYSINEVRSCWYSDEEIAAMKASNKHISHASPEEQESCCLRGLETCIHPLSITSRCIKKSSIATVLMEQQEQRLAGVTDPELIRACYRSTTRRLGSRANDLAQQDALEAETIYREQCPGVFLTVNTVNKRLRPSCWMFDPSSWIPKRISYEHRN